MRRKKQWYIILPSVKVIRHLHEVIFPDGSTVKNLPTKQVTQETWFQSIGSKIPWRRAWTPSSRVLLGKSHDRGAWRAMGHVVAKSWTQMKQLSMHEHQLFDFLKGPFAQKLILLNFSSWHFYLSRKPILDSIYRWSPQTYDGSTLWFFFFFWPLPWFKSNTHFVETITLICSWVRYFLVMMDRGSLAPSQPPDHRINNQYT